MVNEREPPRHISPKRPSPVPLIDEVDVQFGTTSPLRNPLRSDSSRIFNVPKQGQRRPEHHRNGATGTAGATSRPTARSALSSLSQTSVDPSRQSAVSKKSPESPDPVEIFKPVNPPQRTTWPVSRPMFSTGDRPNFVNASRPTTTPFVDSTRQDEADGFDPAKALGNDKFGDYDPHNYMDVAKTSENIKALLEGAFDEDGDEKPKTRLRNKKKNKVDLEAMSNRLEGLTVEEKPAQNTADEAAEGNESSVDGLSVNLLPHQVDGLAWMIDKEIGKRKKNGILPKGGILADDMGLGKTIQALSLILSNPKPSADDLAENPKLKIPDATIKGTLIVAPLALIKQWEREIKSKVNKFPKLRVLVHHGPSRTTKLEDIKKQDIVITTYHTLLSEHERSSKIENGPKAVCFGVHWYRAILDEAHSIKNRNAKMSKAAFDLRSVYRWCLTGTPMQNNLDELQSLIHFLRIKPYCDLHLWREQISEPMKAGRGWLALKRLQYFLKAFMLRRTKDILKQEGALNVGDGQDSSTIDESKTFKLVARKVETVVVEFSTAEREFYEQLADRAARNLDHMMKSAKSDYIGALVLLLRMRQTCNHPDLIRKNLRKEKDPLFSTTQRTIEPQTPGRTKRDPADEVEDIADMFGALSVEAKTCDGCGSALNRAEIDSGLIRCTECEEGLGILQRLSGATRRDENLKNSKHSIRHQKRGWHARRIIDSDDEDDEGEWIVPQAQQSTVNLGVAGGSDDENAEGGGEWLGSDDSDTEDESPMKSRSYSNKDGPVGEASDYGRGRPVDESERSEIDTLGASEDGVFCSSKVRHLLKILQAESDDHKFIVFSEFTSMLDIIEPFLRSAGFRFARYDGSMKNDDREASLDLLRKDAKTRILLCSLRCGSLGLNLTAASRVVILEPFWNPFVEEQAIDRVHRLNQTQDVTVYRLTVTRSVEERVLELQERKRELSKAAIDGGKSVSKLSMQDILQLFKRDAEHTTYHHGVLYGASETGRILDQTSGPQIPSSSATHAGSGTATWYLDNATAVQERPRFKVPAKIPSKDDDIYGRRW